MQFVYGGFSKVGYKREINEDFVFVKELGTNTLLTIIADGNGSEPSSLQPAQIAARQIGSFIENIFDNGNNEKMLIDNAALFLREAVLAANHVVGAFKTANEEIYSGFSCSLTCALFGSDSNGVDRMSYAHIGNTRMYLIRGNADGNAAIRQLTKDQTVAQKLLEDNKISEEQYYYIPERNQILCPLGHFSSPQIDTFSGKIKKDCIFMLSTDGIHYAIRPDAIASLILSNDNLDNASETLCDAAESLKYNDDYGVILIRCY